MWPELFGPGWVGGALMAAGLFGAFLALVWWLGDAQPRRDAADPLLVVWRQYEQGAMTRREFERARRTWGPARDAH